MKRTLIKSHVPLKWKFLFWVVLAEATTPGFACRADSTKAPSVPHPISGTVALSNSSLDAGNPPAKSLPVGFANKWVDALRRRDVSELVKVTHFPFALRDTRTGGTCKPATTSDSRKMAKAVSCLINDNLLHEDLVGNPKPEIKVVSTNNLPSWTRGWVPEIPADATTVSIFIHGNGSSHEFILVVAEDGIQASWKTTMFESN